MGAEDLRDRGQFDLSKAFIDASFSSATKGAPRLAGLAAVRQQNHGDLRRPWSSSRRRPRGQRSPHEVRLVDATLAASFLETLPVRLIGDRGYDSDRLDTHLADTYGIEMIAANRPNRRTKTDDRCGDADAAGKSNACLPA